MTRLTSKQKELFQESKHILVDTVIILEQKLEKTVKELQFAKNELFLCGEAHIKAQQEIDGDRKPETMTKEQSKDFHTKLNDMIVEADSRVHKPISDNKKLEDIEKCLDGAWEGEISSKNFVDVVTKIFTGDYYDKIRKQSSKVD